MKKIFFLIATLALFNGVKGQDFKANISTAKQSYAANKLEDTHFALQQALSEIDITIGKEVLKLMPPKMDTVSVNPKDDHVTANAGYVGATIHRSYGMPEKVQVEIMSNSPLISTLNAFLNSPMAGGMMRDENTRVIKIQGYKTRMERQSGSAEDQYNYVLQLPFNSSLLTFTVYNSNEKEATDLANTLPLAQIAKLLQ